MSKSIGRREFIKKASVAGASLGAMTNLANITEGHSPNEKVSVAVMGTHSRGQVHARSLASLPDVEVTYICDVDDAAIQKGLEAVREGGQESEPQTAKDFRRVLEDDSVDAISMALPVHWHAPASILALQAGKHVYVEKPCSHNPREGELLVAVAKEYGSVVQMGNQRRSWTNVRKALQLLKEGAIGRVYYARCWYASTRESIGYGKVGASIPDGLDFELWQGPAPRRPYRDNLVHYNWHWFWHWGGGELANNGIHFLDLARLGLEVDYPMRVSSSGGRYHYSDDQETPDTQVVTYDFSDGKSITWEALSSNPGGINGSATGITFHGEEGYLSIDGNEYTVFDNENNKVESSGSIDEDINVGHFENFVDSIRNGGAPRSSIEDANISVHLCHLGNIAYRSQSLLHCDPHSGRIVGDSEIMSKYWSREYEDGWGPSV